ncbi:MAG: NAD(+)/NADH kinase [Bacillota bacterium]|nr:NAD(+)/NADH kinase [Bacillota bacterium]
MDRILIHSNTRPFTLEVKERLISMLERRGKKIVTHEPDIVVVIGGDGTVLSAIRRYRYLKVPFVGIDTGTLGFLNTILPDKLEKIFDVLDTKNYRIGKYPSISVRMTTLSGEVYKDYAFNEVIIKHLEPKLMEAKVYFNNRGFNYFTGDGFIVSTPLGATGYAIWAGGAVMHSDLNVFQITPIMANDNSVNRPMKSSMILPHDTKLDISVINAHKRKVIVACDGNRVSNEFIQDIHMQLEEDMQVDVIRSDEFDYFDLFKRKIIDKNVRRKVMDEMLP